LPTIVFWEYREVFIVTDNLAYVLSNVRCLVDSIVLVLFFGEVTSLGTCECAGEMTTKSSPRVIVTSQPDGNPQSRSSRTRSPPPLANVNDL
ncbi:hypothetical protein BIW11_10536, partial [Tropilaelaps mercedesae]